MECPSAGKFERFRSGIIAFGNWVRQQRRDCLRGRPFSLSSYPSHLKKRNLCRPSPQPSPSGRGSSFSRLRGTVVANPLAGPSGPFHKQTQAAFMMDQELALALRERAVAALEISTTMLKVAQNLQLQGNEAEADRLRDEARNKRNESILLMDQAMSMGQRSNVLAFPNRKPTGPLTGPLSDRHHHMRTG